MRCLQKHINTTEDCAVLHMASLQGNFRVCTQRNLQGKSINLIVNIGGFNLRPVMVTEALELYAKRNLTPYFVPNIDVSGL